MASNNVQFSTAYKRLEEILRARGMAVKDYEDSLSDEKQANLLRYCRTTRNFLSHVDAPQFVETTPKMVAFVKELSEKLDEGETTAKKKMVPIAKSLVDSMAVSEAASFMQKRKCESVPFFTKKGELAGVLNVDDIVGLAAKGGSSKTTKLSSLEAPKKRVKQVPLVSATDTVNSIRLRYESCLFVLVENNGAICGWLSL